MSTTRTILPRTQIAYRFFSGNAASYEQVVNLFTLGGDCTWKRSILDKLPAQATQVLDLACGTGILTFSLARRYPQAEILGVDIMPEYLEIARSKAREEKISNVQFILERAEEVVLEGMFDCITGSYLPKYVDPQLLLRNIAPHLRSGGLLVLHDFTYPSNRLVAWVWERYFQFLQAVGPRFFPEWRPVFFELPGFLRTSNWVPELCQALEEHGLGQIEVEHLGWETGAIVSGVGRRL
ncbi:MAG: methyltransferase domain-containing protein [Chloroflexi bacterium]|nr:methyltransferase domain-containing protein [Chloroflexota bacterium]